MHRYKLNRHGLNLESLTISEDKTRFKELVKKRKRGDYIYFQEYIDRNQCPGRVIDIKNQIVFESDEQSYCDSYTNINVAAISRLVDEFNLESELYTIWGSNYIERDYRYFRENNYAFNISNFTFEEVSPEYDLMGNSDNNQSLVKIIVLLIIISPIAAITSILFILKKNYTRK